MTPSELEHYLHRHIPLARAMQVSVTSVSMESVTLLAPLRPNINHQDTVFGGSASALAILASWCLLHVRLREQPVPVQLVIQRNTMEYLLPIHGEFTAESTLQDPESWERQVRMLERKGAARFAVSSNLFSSGNLVGHFTGKFVALASR